MLIHLINLDRSKNRLATFAAANPHLTEVSRVPAVDGETLDIQSLIDQGVIEKGLVAKDFYTVGALGAAFSHLSMWQLAIDSGQPVTIVEDDAYLHSQFETLAPRSIEKLPADWDLISWGWNFDLFMCFEMLPGVSHCLAQFEQDRSRAGVEAFQSQALDPRAFRLVWQFGTPCYTVSPRGARALQSKVLPLRPTTAVFPPASRAQIRAEHFRNVGIDSAMNNAWRETNAYICFPPLAVTKNEPGKSTIQQK
jgi:glycosyl transferase, family 25